ncbi:MAG: N-acyl amino acid synthase FeeM domain-containing protein [Rhizobacter sp.]
MSMQLLRFSLRVARSEADLRAACQVRSASYGRHVPSLRTQFAEPDELDWSPETTVFLAVDKDSGQAVGTARLATNARAPLQLEHSTPLPEPLTDRVLAEVTRLSVLPGHDDPRVKLALMKSTYLYCMARQVHWMVIGARSDGLIRQYRRLGFTDLLADGRMVPFAHAGNLPHRVLGFDVTAAERNWHAAQHPFYDFMVRTYHPDIELFGEPIARPTLAKLALAA